jgi:hypothetical protein
MSESALLTIDEQDGTTRRQPHHFATTTEPAFLIPAVADFYTDATSRGGDLSVIGYRRYAASHPHLPDRELPGNELTRLPERPDRRYHLTLAANTPGLRLSIRTSAAHEGSATPPDVLLTHADLYAAAATCAETIATRIRMFTDSHEDLHLPGADADTWTRRARRYRRRHHTTATRAAAANLAARFHPPTFDGAYPAVHVAGVVVFAYVNPDGVLQVSVDLDETEPWLTRGPHDLVPMEISVNGAGVYTAYLLS